MDQFTYLKEQVPSTSSDYWNFVLNVWLVWKGGRVAYLLETTNFTQPDRFVAVMERFATHHSQVLGIVPDAAQQASFPRWLLYNKSIANATDVQKVQTTPDNFDALARLLKFGCIDPDYENQALTRYGFKLEVQAREFPSETLLSFFCSENVPRPTETWLRQVATPLKNALLTTFHDVHVHWNCSTHYPLKKLVDLFGQFVQGKPGGDMVLTEEGRQNFSSVLSDGEGFNELEEIFAIEELDDYRSDVTTYQYAILALLLAKMCDVGDFINVPVDDASTNAYFARVKCLEDAMINTMPGV